MHLTSDQIHFLLESQRHKKCFLRALVFSHVPVLQVYSYKVDQQTLPSKYMYVAILDFTISWKETTQYLSPVTLKIVNDFLILGSFHGFCQFLILCEGLYPGKYFRIGAENWCYFFSHFLPFNWVFLLFFLFTQFFLKAILEVSVSPSIIKFLLLHVHSSNSKIPNFSVIQCSFSNSACDLQTKFRFFP